MSFSRTEPLHLDNAAATRVDEEALAVFCEAAKSLFANQEGAGELSRRSAKAVEEAGAKLAATLARSSTCETLWTNSGTDALAAAAGAALSFRQGDVVTTGLEHQSLASAIEREAKARKLAVSCARANRDGQVDLASLDSLLSEKTALVALCQVQAETGALQNLVEVRRLIDAKAPRALLLADTTQAALKLEIPWEDARLDFATVSGAKIGAPCGGALLFREDAKSPLGKKVRATRSVEHKIGRCQPAACVALAFQAERLAKTLRSRLDETKALKKAFMDAVRKELGERIRFTVPFESSSPYILHLLAPGLQGATLVRMLSDEGFSVSAGSACEADAKSPSKALLAMGTGRSDAYSALRASFWTGASVQDAEPFAKALAKGVAAY